MFQEVNLFWVVADHGGFSDSVLVQVVSSDSVLVQVVSQPGVFLDIVIGHT